MADQRPSAFLGTYKSKQVLRTVPDAYVKINGNSSMTQCSGCKQYFDINPYISSISVDLSIDSPPGSASISLSIPRHNINDFYGDGHFLIQEMMEIEIFMKGYYYVHGVPQYYPVFWGLVTRVTESYSSGEHSVQLSCADILKWWEKTRLNVMPALPEVAMSKTGHLPLLGNSFAGVNPYDIIFSLSRNISGDLLLGRRTLNFSKADAERPDGKEAVASIMSYWRHRFRRMKNSLVLYGMDGEFITSEVIHAEAKALENKLASGLSRSDKKETIKRYQNVASNALSKMKNNKTGKNFLDPTSPNIVAYKNMVTQAGSVNMWESEYLSKLEVANKAKDAINFEFYMDSTGDIVFKPPFWNLDVRGNDPISWIRDIDVINWDFESSESEVFTVLTMNGSFSSKNSYGMQKEICAGATVIDYQLLSKYGVRAQEYTSEWITNSKALYFHGLDVLDRINSGRQTGSITIPCRPELRMGFPVYIESRDEFWYVTGISHTISFGGRATTNLTLAQKRGKFIAPSNFAMSSEELRSKQRPFSGDAKSVPRNPETGKIEGHPNIVMVYTSDTFTKEQEKEMTAERKPGKSNKRSGKDKITSGKVGAIYGEINKQSKEISLEEALSFIHDYGTPGLQEYTYAQLDENSPAIKAGSVAIDTAIDGRGIDGKENKHSSSKRNKKSLFVFPVSDRHGV